MTEAGAVSPTTSPDCVIVGCGPAGMVLGLLLARRGVRVRLLEMHADFARDFRGDTIHPSTLEMLDRIGVAEELHRLQHGKLRTMRFVTPQASWKLLQFDGLKTRFPYIMIAPQARFLELLHERARRYPHFTLTFNAYVQELAEENGAILGVRYKDEAGRLRARRPIPGDGRDLAAPAEEGRRRRRRGLDVQRGRPVHGDVRAHAAHAMSPVGGVGINCAIGDAVETANVLSEKLREGHPI